MSKKIIFLILFAVLLYFVKEYSNGCKYLTDVRIDGKVVIVTGANTGIGKETVIDLVQRGAKVYMACRSMQRGQAALEDIRTRPGASADNLILMKLDLGSMKSIRDFAQEYKKRENKLDILINNAGVYMPPPEKTEDGFEMHFGINHLGHFLLTNLLVDVLISSAPSRVVTLSSCLHEEIQGINFENLMGFTDYGHELYSHSKLANVIFAYDLGKRLKDYGVSSYSLHPGGIHTDIFRHITVFNLPVLEHIIAAVVSPFLKDWWHGARTTVLCAIEPGLEVHTGKYFSECAIADAHKDAYNDDIARKLWDVSVDLVKLSPKEIHPAVQ